MTGWVCLKEHLLHYMAVSQYPSTQVRTCVLASMDLSEVETSEDASTQVRSLCIWNGSVLDYVVDYVKYVDVAAKNMKNDLFWFFIIIAASAWYPCAKNQRNRKRYIYIYRYIYWKWTELCLLLLLLSECFILKLKRKRWGWEGRYGSEEPGCGGAGG